MAGARVTALQEYGCDTAAALERFINREEMYVKFLDKFLNDDSYKNTVAAIEAGDSEASLKAVHTLKGVAGNLGFTALFNKSSDMVNTYRAGDPAAADAMLPELTKLYEDIINILESTK